MKTYHWGCPACGLADIPADDIAAAKDSLEVHEYAVHKGKQVGAFGCAFPPKPMTAEIVAQLMPWSKAPFPFKAKVFADGTFEVGGVLHGPTSSKGFDWKTNGEAA